MFIFILEPLRICSIVVVEDLVQIHAVHCPLSTVHCPLSTVHCPTSSCSAVRIPYTIYYILYLSILLYRFENRNVYRVVTPETVNIGVVAVIST